MALGHLVSMRLSRHSRRAYYFWRSPVSMIMSIASDVSGLFWPTSKSIRRPEARRASPLALACDAVWVRLLRQALPGGNGPRPVASLPGGLGPGPPSIHRPSGNGFDQTPAALRLATNSRMRFAFMPTSLLPIRDIERISSWLPAAAGVTRITISSLKP